MDDSTRNAAAAAKRVKEDPESASTETSESFVAFMNEPAEKGGTATGGQEKDLTTSAKALDRWFKERQKNHGAPACWKCPTRLWFRTGARCRLPAISRL